MAAIPNPALKKGRKFLCTFVHKGTVCESILIKTQQVEKIIMGIDPGTNNMGLGIIEVKGSKIEIIAMDILKLDKLANHSLKLKKIFETTLRFIDQYHPDEFSIESPFYGKNIQSMLKLGRAQGVAIAAALYRDIPVFEYSPRKIKQSITGKGSASKEQVAGLLAGMLSLQQIPEFYDVTDALAVAVCHHFQRGKSQDDSSSYGSWQAFISQNPGRVKK
jgi:crossover junction endodeoxyribonuclease RuvC